MPGEMVGHPGDGVERVPHCLRALALAHLLAVDGRDASYRGEVDVLPFMQRVAEDGALVPAVVGDQIERVLRQLRVNRPAVVRQLDRRHDAAYRPRDAAAEERGVG